MALDCHPPALAKGLANWFSRPSSPEEPHIRLHFELVPHADTLQLPCSLLQTKRLESGGRFDIADGLIHGHFDATTGQGQVFAKGALTRGLLMRVME